MNGQIYVCVNDLKCEKWEEHFFLEGTKCKHEIPKPEIN